MTWWPEITVDIVQGDLQRLALGRVENNVSESGGEWALPRVANQGKASSRFAVFDDLIATLADMKTRTEKLRQELCMSTFHSLVITAANGSRVETAMPLDFAAVSSIPPSLPSTTSSLSSYEHALSQSASLCLPVTNEVLSHLAEFDVDPHKFTAQDVKDIQRDSVCVNGCVLSGSELGYDSILAAVAHVVGGDEMAAKVLSVGNRTFSGGVAFERVLQTFANDGLVIIAPDSAAAESIDIIAVGNCALIRGHTRYVVRSVTDGRELCAVNATLMAEIPVNDVFSSRAFVFLECSFP